MIETLETKDELEARRRVNRLRQEIERATLAYRLAKEKRQGGEVTTLLRQRSELIQRLFETQRELLLWLGANTADSSESGHSFGPLPNSTCSAPSTSADNGNADTPCPPLPGLLSRWE